MAQTKSSGKQPNAFERLVKYFKDVRSEIDRVVWPTRDDIINSSLVVLVMLILMTGFVSIVDAVAYGLIINVLGKIGG